MTALPTDTINDPSASNLGPTFPSHTGPIDLSPANTTVPKSWANGPMLLLLALGLLCLGATAYAGWSATDAKGLKHAVLSYHVGVMAVTTMMLGSLVLVMISRAVQAGWSTTFRRQSENVAALMPLLALFLVPYLFFAPKVWKWMLPESKGDFLLHAKSWYLNEPFLAGRIIVYVLVFCFFAYKQFTLSRQQDFTGDKALTNKAQFWAMPGLLFFALSAAFFAFDLIMSMDFHWFSTMFGVYFFAGSILSGVALVILITAILRASGRLKGLITREHYHDLGKLLIGFTIFWAYIAFSQYFLIWYANIPEETAWMLVRTNNGWQNVGLVIILGHFVLPFLILLFRSVKTKMRILVLLACWQLIMHVVDLFWQIRPITFMTYDSGNPVSAGKVGLAWVDFTGIIGPIAIFAAGIIFMLRRSPLIPINDPRLSEALNHKNYV